MTTDKPKHIQHRDATGKNVECWYWGDDPDHGYATEQDAYAHLTALAGLVPGLVEALEAVRGAGYVGNVTDDIFNQACAALSHARRVMEEAK